MKQKRKQEKNRSNSQERPSPFSFDRVEPDPEKVFLDFLKLDKGEIVRLVVGLSGKNPADVTRSDFSRHGYGSFLSKHYGSSAKRAIKEFYPDLKTNTKPAKKEEKKEKSPL